MPRPAVDRPVFVYDGDCGFCRRSVRLLERIGPDAELVAYQTADLKSLGLTEARAAESVQWVGPDGTICAGHEAVAAALRTAGPIWGIAGRLLVLPGISWVAAKVYRLVADNRGRL